MTTEPTQAAQVSGIALLIEWANEQDSWIRKLVGEVIETRNKLSDERIGELYDWLCREKKIAGGDSVVVEMLSAKGFGTPVQAAVLLKSLQHIKNVNAIADNQEIKFHERMTICYGENASGKTGYVRILKNAARRTTQANIVDPVLSNIYLNSGKEIPQTRFEFLAGGQECEIEWRGEQGVDHLTQIDIFDSQEALFHLKRDMSYSYTPAELRLFPLVKDGIERVQEKLEKQQPQPNPFIGNFSRKSRIYSKIEKLGTSTKLNDLKILVQISKEENAELPALIKKVEALRSGEVQTQIIQVKKEKDIFEKTLNIADLVNKFEREAYTAALSKLRTARQKREDAMHYALVGEDIPEVLTSVWKEFIRAAEYYIQEIKIDSYPASEGKCIYCRQPLGDAAVNLLKKYRNYCNDTLQKKVDQAHEEVQSISKTICKLRIEKLEKPERSVEIGSTSISLYELVIEQSRSDIDELIKGLEYPSSPPPNLVAARGIVNYALELKKALQQEADCLPLPSNFQESLEIIRRTKEEIETTIASLSAKGARREQALVEAQQKKQDIEARITLAELMPKIDIYIKTDSCLNRFQSIKMSLTNVAKQASEALINRKFTERFNQECKALSAPPVKLDFPGREGEIRKKKTTTAGDHDLVEILSEGEQKVIALADFLADVSLKPNRSPVVFDDPVTSLDYKHLRHVVNRLFDLSQERQVIVFTHDIWFARELLERFETDTTKRIFNEIKSEEKSFGEKSFGIVYQKERFETDSFKIFKKKIIEISQKAQKEEDEDKRLALVKGGYTCLRGACEAVAEQNLLEDVIARYRPNIRMACLKNIKTERLPKAIESIMEVFHQCSRFTEAHSQPLSTAESRPCPNDLEEDLAKVEKALKEYKA